MQGNKVRALLLPHETCPDFVSENRNNLREYVGNLCVKASLEQIFYEDAPSELVVIHCAGLISITSQKDNRMFEVNVGGTANIIEMCMRYPVKRLVYISSVHAIPLLPHGQTMQEVESFDPDKVQGQYDKTKAMATQLVLDAYKSGLDVVVIHPSGIIGPHGLPTGNMSHLVKCYIDGKLPLVIHGEYDFVDVRDVANGIISAAIRGGNGECYILSNRLISFGEIFETLSKICGNKRKSVYIPIWIAKAVTPFTELYYFLADKTPLFTKYSLRKLSENGSYSNEKAKRELDYYTRPLEETLSDTVVLG